MNKVIHLTTTIPGNLAGKRLDQALAILFHDHSRARLQEWIRSGDVRINHQTARQRQRVRVENRLKLMPALNNRQILLQKISHCRSSMKMNNF